jgi:muramoyltetrapeptide carboxypeptidase
MSHRSPNRIHLLSHARPATRDWRRLGFADVDEYVAFIRAHLPPEYKLSFRKSILVAPEPEKQGGRTDDAARVKDLQAALNDANTLAMIALNGGTHLTRILPDLDFSALAKRRTPLWVMGFSEITNLVNVVASCRAGRGVYWLCPNYLGWKVRPTEAGRAAFAAFWRNLPAYLGSPESDDAGYWQPIEGQVTAGKPIGGRIRIIGGCLSVLCANVAGRLAKRVRSDGKWLLIEDIDEQAYRIDRLLATLKLAGWFERIAGVLIGNFALGREDQMPVVAELLRFHMPADRRLPVLSATNVGHTWPMAPVILNRPMELRVSGRRFTIR